MKFNGFLSMASENKEEKLESGEVNNTAVPDPKEKTHKKNGDSKLSKKSATWERFSNWIHCICVVTFDLELGQAIEVSNVAINLFSVSVKLSLVELQCLYNKILKITVARKIYQMEN